MYQCSVVNNLIDSLKLSYFTSVIEAHSNDQKVLFKTVNKLLQKKTFRCYASARSNCSKSCNLVPLPSHIINGCFDRLLPIITSIVYLSLATGVMPEPLKLAKRRPSLKKPDADHEKYVSFRPTLNQPMVSKLKVLKRLPASDQFTRHVLIHHLDESLESAYEMFYWTETVLVKVQNDVPVILCFLTHLQHLTLWNIPFCFLYPPLSSVLRV